ncbi:MAG: hypothetical protein KC468_01750, partial [Myxococcales bacterium]|nr:hypothetical protein [Myxococcales bacterium]
GEETSGEEMSGAETSGAEVFALAPSSRRAALPWVGLGLALATAAALALVFGGGGRLVNFGDGPIERVEAPFEHASDSAPLPARARHGGVNAASSGTRVTLEPSPDEPPPSELASPRPPTSSRPDDAPTGARLGPASARAEPPATSSLAAETEALRRVRSELSRGEPARALELLDDHARRFPAGVLVEERAALRVVALCDAGRRADGRAAAGRFLARYPSSALAGRVRAACPAG